MQGEEKDNFDSAKAHLFEALGHPNRIRILQAMEAGPIGFADLKRQMGIESSGHLAFHLGKLEGLVSLGPDGRYGLTDDGREALRMIRAARERGEGAPRGRSIEIRRTLLAGLVLALFVLAAVAGIQQLQITQLTNSPQGTVQLAGRSYWSASFPLSDLPTDHNFTFTFHGVTFTLSPRPVGSVLIGSANFNVVGTSATENGTIKTFSVSVSNGTIIGQNMTFSIQVVGLGEKVWVSFPDGSEENVQMTQPLSGNIQPSSLEPPQGTWLSTHTGPQAGVTEGSDMITFYISA